MDIGLIEDKVPCSVDLHVLIVECVILAYLLGALFAVGHYDLMLITFGQSVHYMELL